MSGSWLDESEILSKIYFVLNGDLNVSIRLGITCLVFLFVPPLPQILSILNS